MTSYPCIFLDRDGTINEMVYDFDHGIFDSPKKVSQVVIKPYAEQFVTLLKSLGFKIIIVTNQPGIAKGTLNEIDLLAINERILSVLGPKNIDGIYICPHHPTVPIQSLFQSNGECSCRKPKPGLLLQAVSEHKIDLSKSWMIGDGITDIQMGISAGCKTMMIANIKTEHIEKFFSLKIEPDILIRDFREALTVMQKNKVFR